MHDQRYVWDRKHWNGSKIRGHQKGLAVRLVCKSKTWQNELRIWSESKTGERVRLEAETTGIRKKVGLILERLGHQRVSRKTQQQQQRASDNQTPTKITHCIESTHGQVRIPRKPSK
jgi:hypothetical protein